MTTVSELPLSSLRRATLFGGEKIQARHYQRSALVYVRQSTPQQVLNHRESTELQYKLVERAAAFGWPTDQIQVIDDDLGLSARTAENRAGFQRLLAEVATDHVGLVLGIEMSRLARSCKDWYHLLEVCALFGTLLADQDGLYDPSNYNDRLLLGLKGTMSEAELHVLQGRMHQGRLNKAARGALFSHPPIGYVRDPYQGVVLDPDEQVRMVIELIFDKFTELGSINAVTRYLRLHDIRLGFRPHHGDQRGTLQWRLACRGTIRQILRNPIYSGAYVYGRFPIDPKKKLKGRASRQRWEANPEHWQVLLKDRLPAYITWERFEKNCQLLTANYARVHRPGVSRNGAALLGGILRCAKCGGRMSASYGGRDHTFRYSCDKNGLKDRGRCCQALTGEVVDDLVVQQVFKALQPVALDLSCQAAAAIERERERLQQHWRQRITRARYDAQLAQRRYEAVDPMNRLVAGSLEARWEASLKDLAELETAHAQFLLEQPVTLTASQKEAILALASDIPALWRAPTTQPSDRQTILRFLIEEVVVDVLGGSERFEVAVRWKGGYESRHAGLRPIHRFEQLQDYDRLLARAMELRRMRYSSPCIADILNAEGFRSPHLRQSFTKYSVHRLLNNRQSGVQPQWRRSFASQLRKGEMWLRDLAVHLGMSYAALHNWVRLGWVSFRKVLAAGGMLALMADDAELARLRQLRDHCRQFPRRAAPAILKTPRASSI